MLKIVVSLTLGLFFITTLYAGQSAITESEGYACMGEDRTKRQTEETALQDAKRNAIEQASTYIKSETEVKDFKLQKDIINAYTDAKVKILEQKGRWDSEPPKVGDCYRITIKAEVIPNESAIKNLSESKDWDNPSLPFKVRLWTEKREFKRGEKIKIFFKGNKPFYATIVYRQVDGSLIQILPNLYRQNNYFQGGVVYEIPSGPDKFELEVTPPFGEENIVIYASTSPMGNLDLEKAGGVYLVKSKDLSEKTRGITIIGKGEKSAKAGEFFEEMLEIKTK
ncbi:MAG: DUF4384 domain-containing protein [Calditerrivibrio sp.]|nr:DUF4384 domain-containing protein [Calditerrivibrio sp.]MCA1980218.1 DUF4384 domain-containing protein [Calditerrivibrio sp.]